MTRLEDSNKENFENSAEAKPQPNDMSLVNLIGKGKGDQSPQIVDRNITDMSSMGFADDGNLLAKVGAADEHKTFQKNDGVHEQYFLHGKKVYEDIKGPGKHTETSYDMLGRINCQRVTAKGESQTYLRTDFDEYKVVGNKVLKKDSFEGTWEPVSDKEEIANVKATIAEELKPPRLIRQG